MRHAEMRQESEIDAVLAFWFGDRGETLDDLQSQRWFARDEKRDEVDAAVAARFGGLVRSAEAGGLSAWACTPRGAVALIVVLDQLARHALRLGLDASDEAKRGYEQRVKRCSARAKGLYEAAFGAADRPGWNATAELSPARQVFAWMAARHCALPGGAPGEDAAALRALLADVDARLDADAQQGRALDRFRKATARRLRLAETTHPSTLDDDSILDRAQADGPIAAVRAAAMDSALGRTLQAFVLAECDRAGLNCTGFEGEQLLGDNAEGTPRGPGDVMVALISLSGGVDSMVLTWLLCQLRDAAVFPHSESRRFYVSAAHINYGNRPESNAEADFLKRWAKSLRCDLTVRAMPETLRRGVTARDAYEALAREARFALYAAALRNGAAVLLGHHAGDVAENCLSNALKGVAVLGLSGMLAEQRTHGVRVARPLLRHHKEEILTVSHGVGVPYFLDSTPKWSTRGRLRDEIVPLLSDVYGTGSMRNLERLAFDADALTDLAQARIFSPFAAAVQRGGAMGCFFDAASFQHEGAFFWRHVMMDLAHSLGMGALSEKALRVVLARLAGQKGHKESSHDARRQTEAQTDKPPCPGWLNLKKGWSTYLDGRGFIYIFREAFFLPLDDAPAVVAVGGTETRIGRWAVSASDSDGARNFEPTTLDALFVSGAFSYDVVVCADVSTLEYAGGKGAEGGERCKAQKTKKPPHLRALDDLTDSPLLREHVPLLTLPRGDETPTRRLRLCYRFVGDDS
ncbi:hypothetical protein M885DRAFT_507317 [Pelagophyceae sp. CCMP2097]|nr:hypothetical protein M885DRAFT_507317 [Pelagophyceae sp. CCMP2097]